MTAPNAGQNRNLDALFTALDQERILPLRRRRNLEFYLDRYLFEGINFKGKTVLEIGAGDGLHSFYAASKGAAKVVSLEPEAEGSTAGVQRRFYRLRSRLGLEDVVGLCAVPFQQYDAGDLKFDIVLLYDSVNHLDESACVSLAHNSAAVAIYQAIFHAVSALCHSGAHLIIADCSRFNFWKLVNLPNPFAPTVEWDKHQPPMVWSNLLSQCGFYQPRVRWRGWRAHGLREPGIRLLGNRFVTYFLDSHFCLTMDKI